MLKRFLSVLVAAGVVFGTIAGCSNDPETGRSVVFVSSLNCGVPVFSDVREQGDSLLTTSDDFFAEDWPLVWFNNKPNNPLIITEPGSPHGDVIVESYRVEWSRADNGPVLATRVEQMALNVPSLELAPGQVRLVSLDDKFDPILVALQSGGNILMTATVTFNAREAGTSREFSFVGRATVQFADYFVATDDKEDPPSCNQ